jgi:hypothetical protein
LRRKIRQSVRIRRQTFCARPGQFSERDEHGSRSFRKGDADRLISYGEKTQGILQRYKNAPAPAGSSAEAWTQQKAQTLEANKDGITYIQNAVFSGVYQTMDAGKRAAPWCDSHRFFRTRRTQIRRLSSGDGVSAGAERAEDARSANGLLAKDPNNVECCCCSPIIMARRANSWTRLRLMRRRQRALVETAKKPEEMADDQWKQQGQLQKDWL